MARIRILELPTKQVGEYYETPFALVIDKVEVEDIEVWQDGQRVRRLQEFTQAEGQEAARLLGAVGAIVTPGTLDID